MKNYNIRKGDLLIVCELTGMSHSMVKKVSQGKRSNTSIEKALKKISSKRAAEDKKMLDVLERTLCD
ncbi:hypothetical protein ACWA1C_06435 [Flectobacillus roseus]